MSPRWFVLLTVALVGFTRRQPSTRPSRTTSRDSGAEAGSAARDPAEPKLPDVS
jgi:hypothetical protein